jgi:hypothetical protein
MRQATLMSVLVLGKTFSISAFLIGNFWPVALNKAHIVCTRLQAQLPEPSCIKDPIRRALTLVLPFLVKMFHGCVFSQLRHECLLSPDDLWFPRQGLFAFDPAAPVCSDPSV